MICINIHIHKYIYEIWILLVSRNRNKDHKICYFSFCGLYISRNLFIKFN